MSGVKKFVLARLAVKLADLAERRIRVLAVRQGVSPDAPELARFHDELNKIRYISTGKKKYATASEIPADEGPAS